MQTHLQSPTKSLFQLRAAWIIPFFCYQIFDFALNTLVAVSIVVYPNTIQDYLQQLVRIVIYSRLSDNMKGCHPYMLLRYTLCSFLFSLTISLTKRRLPHWVMCVWFSLCWYSSAVSWALRYVLLIEVHSFFRYSWKQNREKLIHP